MTEDDDPKSDLYTHWEAIIAEADIKEVPLNFLKEISIKMIDGSSVTFDIRELLASGFVLKELEKKVHDFVDDFDDEIDTFDFHIDIEALAKEVNKKTRGLLD